MNRWAQAGKHREYRVLIDGRTYEARASARGSIIAATGPLRAYLGRPDRYLFADARRHGWTVVHHGPEAPGPATTDDDSP